MTHGRGSEAGIDGRHCGVRAQYTGMAQVAPGHDVYQVGFLCGCGLRWGERMSYNRAMVMREEQQIGERPPPRKRKKK